jgi:hypothetical protein
MTTPTIGYEDDTTLNRIEVATVQLETAINLFISKKFLSAITLAGAAEEILGKLVERTDQKPIIRQAVENIALLRSKTGLKVMSEKSEKEIIDGWNKARNAAKHLVNCEEETIRLNLCDEAYWMIKRCLENTKLLKVSLSNELDFENWFVINVAM